MTGLVGGCALGSSWRSAGFQRRRRASPLERRAPGGRHGDASFEHGDKHHPPGGDAHVTVFGLPQLHGNLAWVCGCTHGPAPAARVRQLSPESWGSRAAAPALPRAAASSPACEATPRRRPGHVGPAGSEVRSGAETRGGLAFRAGVGGRGHAQRPGCGGGLPRAHPPRTWARVHLPPPPRSGRRHVAEKSRGRAPSRALAGEWGGSYGEPASAGRLPAGGGSGSGPMGLVPSPRERGRASREGPNEARAGSSRVPEPRPLARGRLPEPRAPAVPQSPQSAASSGALRPSPPRVPDPVISDAPQQERGLFLRAGGSAPARRFGRPQTLSLPAKDCRAMCNLKNKGTFGK